VSAIDKMAEDGEETARSLNIFLAFKKIKKEQEIRTCSR